MGETRRVVRREPQEAGKLYGLWNVEHDFQDQDWPCRNSEQYTDDQFHATFIDADRAADEQWNAVIEKLTNQFMEDFPSEVKSISTLQMWVWLKRHLRPIAPAEGETDE